jgi:hypothetical protein
MNVYLDLRLHSLTTKPCGTAVPTQFYSLTGERTLQPSCCSERI